MRELFDILFCEKLFSIYCRLLAKQRTIYLEIYLKKFIFTTNISQYFSVSLLFQGGVFVAPLITQEMNTRRYLQVAGFVEETDEIREGWKFEGGSRMQEDEKWKQQD